MNYMSKLIKHLREAQKWFVDLLHIYIYQNIIIELCKKKHSFQNFDLYSEKFEKMHLALQKNLSNSILSG